MLAVGVLLARVDVGGLSGAWVVWALSTAWSLSRGKLVLGLATSGLVGLLIWRERGLPLWQAPAQA